MCLLMSYTGHLSVSAGSAAKFQHPPCGGLDSPRVTWLNDRSSRLIRLDLAHCSAAASLNGDADHISQAA